MPSQAEVAEYCEPRLTRQAKRARVFGVLPVVLIEKPTPGAFRDAA
jgi:hypothetical protein